MDIGMSNGDVNKSGADTFGDLFKDDYAVILLQGRNSFGDPIYSYVEVALPNIKRLYATLNSGQDFTPSDFGVILSAGKGTPSEALRKEMASTYNMLQPSTQGVVPKPSTSAPVQKKAWDEY